MKTLGRISFLFVALSLATAGWGQAVFNKFGPAAGIQKNTGATYQNTAAAAADVTGLYSGCTGLSTQYLAANSTCQPVTSAVSGANPTASVGLSTVNGSATTYMRSDAAPTLSQAIAPTWSGTHTFTNTTANIVLNNSGGALDTKNTLFRESTTGFLLQSATDAAPTTAVTSIFTAARSGTAWTAINFGNATDNPTFTFAGTGTISVSGGLVLGSATGGSQGAGTINMTGCFVNGVACSTGGAAAGNPTASIGLTAVNGAAATYLRSDGAPALSQAISPTWTGTHTFSSLVGTGATVFQGANTGSGFNIKFRDTTNSLDRGFIGLGTTTVAGAAVTDFAVVPALSGSVVIGTGNGAAIGTRFGPNGNVTINTPSSGSALTVNQFSTTNGIVVAAASAQSAAQTFSANAGTNLGIIGTAGASAQIVNDSGAGDVIVRSSTGVRLTANGGSSSNLAISSAGGVIIGAPTGGDKGSGSINAQALYVNGVTIGSVGAVAKARVVSDGSATCSISGTATGIASVAWLSTGCTITFTGSFFSAAPICTVTPDTVTGGTEVVAKFDTTPSSSSTHAIVQNVSGGALVGATMNIICLSQ